MLSPMHQNIFGSGLVEFAQPCNEIYIYLSVRDKIFSVEFIILAEKPKLNKEDSYQIIEELQRELKWRVHQSRYRDTTKYIY